MKNFKMKTIIIGIVSVTTAVCIALLCILAWANSNTMLMENINANMTTYLEAQTNSVEEFVTNSERTLKLYSESGLVKQLILEDLADALSNPDRELPAFTDESYNTAAYFADNYPSFASTQQYTLNYYSDLDNWEGLYVGNFETRVLAYSVPPVIGKVLREDPAKVEELMNYMSADLNGVYNAGIIVSPGTGQLCLSMYCPVLEDGVMLGYVGAGVFNTNLENILTSLELGSDAENYFYMINTQTGITYIDTEASEEEQTEVIAQETTRPMLLEVINRSAAADKGQFEFKNPSSGKMMIVNYEKIPGYDWAIVIAADRNELYAASVRNLTVMIVLGVIAFLLVTVLVTVLASKLSKSLEQTVDELNKTAGGEISSATAITSSVTEINQIGKSLTDLKSKFADVILKTKDMSENLNMAGSNLANSADQASATSGHVTGVMAEVSRGAASQAESVQTASQCTDSMGNDIDDISANITTLNEITGSMKENCNKITSALEQIVQQNTYVSDAISEINETIDATDKSANEIAKFSDAINNIASQTNLLSLNASIEAARAGEAGRGFAIVADEIRQLADQSKNSADEIKAIIDRLIVDTKASVRTMGTLNESFQTQGKQIISAQQDMDVMADNVSTVSENSKSIGKMVTNLKSAKETLVDLVENLSAISEENAASTEQTSISMTELDTTFTVINESAAELGELASDLTETINYFK